MFSTFKQIFVSRLMFLMLLMGFSSGLPLALTGTGGTLQAWMTDEGVNVRTLGIFALMGLPYALKFLWAPLMDRFSLPFLGQRRGWMLLTQILCVCTLLGNSFLKPSDNIMLVAWVALLLAFFSASQDIVIDAYRAETLPEEQRGAGAAVSILGYRLGMIVSGALALVMADHLSWQTVYLVIAGGMGIGMIATLMAPEPQNLRPPRSLKAALLDPFRQFFARHNSLSVLAFVILYNLGYVMALALLTRFLMDKGYSKSDIGYAAKTLGFAASIFGALTAGALMSRISLSRALLYFGLMQMLSVLSFTLLSIMDASFWPMAIIVGAEQFCAGMSGAALAALLMGLCDKGNSATQYALLSSLSAVARTFAGSLTGFMAVELGWTLFFIVCAGLAIPALLLLPRVQRPAPEATA